MKTFGNELPAAEEFLLKDPNSSLLKSFIPKYNREKVVEDKNLEVAGGKTMFDEKELARRQKVYDNFMPGYREYNSMQREQNKVFDKELLVLASGLFGISFAFIGNILPSFYLSDYRIIMFIGWVFLAFTALIVIVNHFLCSLFYDSCRRYTKENIHRGYKNIPYINKEYIILPIILRVLHCVALICFIGGLLCLMIFMALSL